MKPSIVTLKMSAADASKTEPAPGIVPPSTALAILETDIQNKAAILKAKLLEKRASSRGANKPDNEEKSSAFDRPAVERQDSDSAIDKLVREARAAAEAQAKQKESPYDEPAAESRIEETTAQRVSPVESTPTLTPPDSTVQNSSKARKGGQKSSKQAKNAAKAGLRAQRLQQEQDAAQQMSKSSSTLLGKQAINQIVEPSSIYIGSKINVPDSKETKKERNAKLEHEGNKTSIKNKVQQSNVVGPRRETQTSSTPAAEINMRTDTLFSTSMLHQEPSTALVPVAKSPSTVTAQVGQDSVASYSHHFDDLDEWLEVTGYHDRWNREQTLSLHRRKAQLEREMAEIDRELEQTASSRARSVRAVSSVRLTSSVVSSMPPPPAPSGIFSASGQEIPPTGSATRTGAKRGRSPERSFETQHAEKHQRTGLASKLAKPSNSDKTGASSNALEIPLGPR